MTPDPSNAQAEFQCESTGRIFKSRNALFRHLREIHADTKQFADPPSKHLEADRQSAPVVHAKTSALATKDKKSTKPKDKSKDKDTDKEHLGEKKSLQIETRPDAYEDELKAKTAHLQQSLQGFSRLPIPTAEVFASSPEHFRMRVEFDIFHRDGKVEYAMHAGKELLTVDKYPMGAKLIADKLMPIVLQVLQESSVLREKLFQINFHATLHGDSIVSLLYRTPMNRTGRRERMLAQAAAREAEGKLEDTKLTAEWEKAAADLSAKLGGASIVGRTRGHKVVIGRLWVEEELTVAGVASPLKYRQLEGFFSQSNAEVCQHMLSWARAVAFSHDAALDHQNASRSDDLLELYCGNGNFCVALAPLFRKVFATEMVKELLDATKHNAEVNQVSNISVGRVSAEELALAMSGSRTFTRLQHIDLNSFDFQTVLVDPPRAGLGPDVAKFLVRFPRIVYISCSPETLREDLVILSETHDIKRLAAFDQFPYTEHLEMGILLERRESASCSSWSPYVVGLGMAGLLLMTLARR